MTPNEALRKEAGKWLREAEKDLHAATLLLRTEDPEPSRSLFHSQQAAEKAAKSFLAFQNTFSARRTILWRSGCNVRTSIRPSRHFSTRQPMKDPNDAGACEVVTHGIKCAGARI